MGNVAANVVDIAADKTLTLTSGGLLFFSNLTQTVGSVNSQGTLTSGGPELFVYTQGTGDQRVIHRIGRSRNRAQVVAGGLADGVVGVADRLGCGESGRHGSSAGFRHRQ